MVTFRRKSGLSTLDLFNDRFSSFMGAAAGGAQPQPIVTGHVITGETLTVSPGSWSNSPDSFQYQWTRAGSNITGAVSNSYVVTPNDEGEIIRCNVTAIIASASAGSATSNGLDTWYPGDASNLIAWYDAADTSQIAINGSLVTTWFDKSGNGHNLQPYSDTFAPAPSGSLNGKNTIVCAQDFLINSSSAASIIPSGTDISIAYVTNNTTNDANYSLYWSDTVYPNSSYNGFGTGFNILEFHAGPTGTDFMGLFYCDGLGNSGASNQDIFIISGTSTSGAHVTSLNLHQATLFPTASLSYDGIQLGSGSFTLARDGRAASSFTLGGHASSFSTSRRQDGDLADFIICGLLTSNEMSQLEGYVAHKWGLESNLPESHPYKDSPLTVSV